MSLKDILSQNVKSLRERRGFTQVELAKRAHISTGYVGSIETKKKFPAPDKLDQIALALGVRPYRLLQSDDDIIDIYSPDQIYKIEKQLEQNLASALNQTFEFMRKERK